MFRSVDDGSQGRVSARALAAALLQSPWFSADSAAQDARLRHTILSIATPVPADKAASEAASKVGVKTEAGAEAGDKKDETATTEAVEAEAAATTTEAAAEAEAEADESEEDGVVTLRAWSSFLYANAQQRHDRLSLSPDSLRGEVDNID